MLLCANCHREIHNDNYNLKTLKTYVEEHDITKKEKEIVICKNCGKIISANNKHQLCSECYIKLGYNKKVKDRPSKEDLQKLLNENSLNKIGKMFGVTHNTIKKWGISYGIIQV